MLSLVLGLMIGLAMIREGDRTRRLRQIAQRDPAMASRMMINPLDPASTQIQSDIKALQETIGDLQKKNAAYEKVLAQQSGESRALANSIQDTNRVAGLTELVGPGIMVTLVDGLQGQKKITEDVIAGQEIVHDYDVLRMVNELWNAGAEAISVSGQRIAIGTSIRCVGSVIRVNDVPMAPPYIITAIGDSKTLAGALKLPGGIVEELREIDPKMVKIEAVDKVKVPAFKGSMMFKYGKVPKEAAKP